MRTRLLIASILLLATLAGCEPAHVVGAAPTPSDLSLQSASARRLQARVFSMSHRGKQSCSVMFFHLEADSSPDSGLMKYYLSVSVPYLKLESSITGTIGSARQGAIGLGNDAGNINISPMPGFTWGQVEVREQLDISGIEALY
ncbi:MAG: hypothetical protein ACI9EF_003550 [Pseudohongiellaceae bacterium]|jgi:hypothetical protein